MKMGTYLNSNCGRYINIRRSETDDIGNYRGIEPGHHPWQNRNDLYMTFSGKKESCTRAYFRAAG